MARLGKAVGEVENAKVELAVAVGMHATQPIDIPSIDQSPSPQVIEASANDLVRQALAKRPDLIAAADKIKAAQYQEKEARSKLFPKISVFASEQYIHTTNNPRIPGVTELNGNTYLVVGTLHWDIFDGRAHYHHLQLAKSQVREAKGQLDSLRLQAEQEVLSAYTSVVNVLEEQDAAQAVLDAATESFYISIYLLIGLAWFALYSAIDVFYPGSIQRSSMAMADRPSELLYFSLVTLSTIGYGDVVPLYEVRMLAALEGVTGVLYVAITVALLVSAYKQQDAPRERRSRTP